MNPCAECQACCYAFPVGEKGKPAFMRCEWQVERGCSHHADRPKQCADFDCIWRQESLRGVLGLQFRPDRCGIILTMPKPETGIVYAREVYKDASLSYWGKRLIKTVNARFAVVVTAPQEVYHLYQIKGAK